MQTDIQWVEQLLADFKKEGLFIRYTIDGHIARLQAAEFLLIVYFPGASRIEADTSEKVIHLDIDVLRNSYPIVMQRIKGLMGKGQRIYARQTVAARVDKGVTLNFLEEYHLNGPLPGKYRYGLFYKGELLSIAVFSGGRILRNISENYRSFELLRFCHKADILVVGGISKLIKAFIADFKPNDIMTYADRDWSQQSSLTAIGFKEENITTAQVFYVKNGKRIPFSEEKNNFDYLIKNNGSIKLKLYL